MKITIRKSDKILELITAMASKDASVAYAARQSLAKMVGPAIQQVINQAPVMSNLFTTFEFNEDDDPSIPLDLYTDVSDEQFLQTWAQVEAAGLAYNQPTPPTNELKFDTFNIDSAVAFDRKFAQRGRLDVIGATMKRMSQEVLLKQNNNSATIILSALAAATSNVKGSQVPHIIRSSQADRILLEDYLKLFTLHKRIRASWARGTADGSQSRGLTDMLVSPEIIEGLRGLAYNPVNTRGGVITENSSGDGGIADSTVTLPDEVRLDIMRSAGTPNFYNVNLIELYELGVGEKYNNLFGALAGNTNYPGRGGAGASQFNGSTEQICIGLDLTDNYSLIRPVATDSETGAQFTMEVDDQFKAREKKIGWFGGLREGRVVLDDRVLCGLIV